VPFAALDKGALPGLRTKVSAPSTVTRAVPRTTIQCSAFGGNESLAILFNRETNNLSPSIFPFSCQSVVIVSTINVRLVPFPGGNVVKNLLKEAQPVESVLQTIGDVGFPS
jgi:hypothetical protein